MQHPWRSNMHRYAVHTSVLSTAWKRLGCYVGTGPKNSASSFFNCNRATCIVLLEMMKQSRRLNWCFLVIFAQSCCSWQYNTSSISYLRLELLYIELPTPWKAAGRSWYTCKELIRKGWIPKNSCGQTVYSWACRYVCVVVNRFLGNG